MKWLKNAWAEHQDWCVFAVVVFFAVTGAIQYALGLEYVLKLMPLVPAILTAIALLYWSQTVKIKLWLFVFAVLFGYFVELIGVKTGLIFGDYSYTSVLGIALLGVPIAIGLTWFMVTASAWHIAKYAKWPKYQAVLMVGGLAVMFDLILEQFATAFGLWAWAGGEIPILNYATWFIVALIIGAVFARFDEPQKNNAVVASLLPLMACFFWVMPLIRG